MNDVLQRLVSNYNQRVATVAAKLLTYQITQERKVSLFPDRSPSSYFSKDWVFVESTEDVDDFTSDRHIVVKICGKGRV